MFSDVSLAVRLEQNYSTGVFPPAPRDKAWLLAVLKGAGRAECAALDLTGTVQRCRGTQTVEQGRER